jgi:hypothetical protein
MKVIGRGSVAAFIKPALDMGWRLSWAGLCIAAGLSLLYFGSLAAGGRLTIPGMEAVAEPGAWQAVGISLITYAVYATALIVITGEMRAIFATLVEGDPFVPENARRVRWVAWAIVGLELARYAISAAANIILVVFGQPETGQITVKLLNINLAAWTAVVVLIVLAEIFREGAALRRDQQLTI